MNAIRIETLAIAAGLTLAALAAPACAQAPDGADPQGVEEPAPAARAAETGGAALRIEQAERSLDVGRDLPAARAALEEVVRDATTPPEQRDQARLALSRALEAQGDHEAATVAVEALFAEHEDGARFPLGRDHRRRDRREGGLQRRARQRAGRRDRPPAWPVPPQARRGAAGRLVDPPRGRDRARPPRGLPARRRRLA